ncbi:pectate lyase [Cellulomonas humilata]|uniref:pectate lyase n=1 Tax=Cellulomonas humilata TaxID=144055 RepID=A0ABU0EBA9_9CELL|nr:pectate lyase [Cellulomonas humilata]MDQ0372536.1 hypothetical protein [Cellulomonas humilata]
MRRAPARRPLAALATLAMAATIGVTAISMSAAQAASGNLSLGAGADGSSKASGTSYGNVKDGSLSTYWSPSGSTGSISIKWGSATAVSSASIVETSGSSGRIGAWKLINADSGAVLKTGSGAGVISFSSTSLKKLTFEITSASSTPQVAEFETYAGGTTPTSSPTSSPTSTPTSSPTSSPTAPPSGSWPTATGQKKVSSTIAVSGTLDGGNVRYYGISSGDQDESQPPIFQLSDGATLKNVIIGTGAGDGVHCTGTCTLENVWWEDVGEDAATLKGSSSSQVMTVNGGGAKGASDKVFQHNGPGRFVIKNFQVTDFGKLYRSCGNCSKQYARTVVIDNIKVTAPGKSLVGINSNLGDKATITNVTIYNDSSKKIVICEEYKGVTSGEPSKIGSGPSSACGYSTSSITYK